MKAKRYEPQKPRTYFRGQRVWVWPPISGGGWIEGTISGINGTSLGVDTHRGWLNLDTRFHNGIIRTKIPKEMAAQILMT